MLWGAHFLLDARQRLFAAVERIIRSLALVATARYLTRAILIVVTWTFVDIGDPGGQGTDLDTVNR